MPVAFEGAPTLSPCSEFRVVFFFAIPTAVTLAFALQDSYFPPSLRLLIRLLESFQHFSLGRVIVGCVLWSSQLFFVCFDHLWALWFSVFFFTGVFLDIGSTS